MRCKRCRGLVVVDSFADGEINDGFSEPGAWRCVNCGAITDVRVLTNRAARRSQLLQLADLIVGKPGRPRRVFPRSSVSNDR